MIVLDTHALLWLVEGSRELGRTAREAIDRATAVLRVAVSAMSFWEIAMLMDKHRITLHQPAKTWRDELLEAGLVELPVTGDIGIRSVGLADLPGDPADRIIVATAFQAGATLVTADRHLLEWPGALRRLDARR